MKLNDIFYALNSSAIHLKSVENERALRIDFRVSATHVDLEKLRVALNQISPRDAFSLSYKPDNSDFSTAVNSSQTEELIEFAETLDSIGLPGKIELTVSKKIESFTISVYSLDLMVSGWKDGGLVQTFEKILALSSRAYYLECFELHKPYATGLFVFGPKRLSSIPPKSPENPNRDKIIGLRSKACNIYLEVIQRLIPDDFKFSEELPHDGVCLVFRKLQTIICASYLADTTRGEADQSISILLKGYKTANFQAPSLDKIATENSKVFFDIYSWAYTDGNVVDKLGICRNVISIHVNGGELLDLKPGCLEAIYSNYVIYLKENLKQYVDLKNKLSEQIQKSSEKASDVSKNINSYLRGSIFSVCSFIFSVFLIRSLGKTTTDPILNDGAYSIFLLLMFVSVLVLSYAVTETNSELRRYKRNYKSFQNRYTDLISSEDLNLIFSNNKDYNGDIAYIKSSRRRAVCLWLISLIVIFGFVTFIYLKRL
ncbi:hypothetical protein [Pseudomonas sp. PD9R]|uniref:hypothetical protein n=1 Tax=Pseudomonas sp. PD9R TaxID=2853534 RepID=UPI001C445F91|nr:hypothetical protein [Pseudomonas sp. PD9R]MBV6822776.1 hypothetical protein [Pseudomonas sp. PD9R]